MFYRLFIFIPLILSVFIFPLWGVSQAGAGQVNAFIYHRFDESNLPSTNISSPIFRQQLDYLKQHDIDVISLDEIAARLETGTPLPEHAAALSVDDGYLSFYRVALPIIEEYGYPVTLFVNTDAVGGHGYMSWDQLRDARRRGVTIANHTASHAYLVEMEEGETPDQWRTRIARDIEKAQAVLKKHLGVDSDLFVYPYGEYSPDVVEVVKKIGFKAAFAQQSGVIHSASDRYTLPRFPMGGPFATLSGFVSKLTMKPLVVSEQSPLSPVVGTNPPELLLNIPGLPSPRGVNCFVQGDNTCSLVAAADHGAGWYKVVAEKPLTGRRNKYTLTTLGEDGSWHWFSHLWIRADRRGD